MSTMHVAANIVPEGRGCRITLVLSLQNAGTFAKAEAKAREILENSFPNSEISIESVSIEH